MKNFCKMLESRQGRVLITCLPPVLLLCVSLLFLCIKPLSVYMHNCFFEVLALSVGWILFWILFIVWQKLSDSHPMNRALILVIVSITILLSFPHAKIIAKGRYVFYKYGMHLVPRSDIRHIKLAIKCLENKRWEIAKLHIDSCSKESHKFFSFSIGRILQQIKTVDTSKENFKKILTVYEMTPSILAIYKSMANDFGGAFAEDYLYAKKCVKEKIDSIEELYNAVSSNDNSLCKTLVQQNGNYWFEPMLVEKILASEDCVPILKQLVIKDDCGKKYKKSLEYAWKL